MCAASGTTTVTRRSEKSQVNTYPFLLMNKKRLTNRWSVGSFLGTEEIESVENAGVILIVVCHADISENAIIERSAFGFNNSKTPSFENAIHSSGRTEAPISRAESMATGESADTCCHAPERSPALVPGGIIPLSVSLDFTVVLELNHGRNNLKLPQNKSRKKYRSKKICPDFHASALRQAREARQGSVPL